MYQNFDEENMESIQQSNKESEKKISILKENIQLRNINIKINRGEFI